MKARRILAAVLVLLLTAGMIPAVSAAAAAPTAENLQPGSVTAGSGAVLTKEATPLSRSNETNITLSVTPTETNVPVAVEFVLDGTDSFNDLTDSDSIKQMADAVRSLFAGRQIHVGITVFGRSARVVQPMAPIASLTADTQSVLENTVDWLTSPEALGTNVQSGIRAGLADLTNAPANAQKYLILVTDGGSYWWLNGNTPANHTVGGTYMMNSDAADMGYDSFPSLNTLLAAGLSAQPAQYADSSAFARIKSDSNLYTNFETGVYWAAKELAEIPRDVNLITLWRPYYENAADLQALTKLAKEFVDLAAARSVHSARLPQNWPLTDAMKGWIPAAAGGALPKGTKIVDVMGRTHSYETEVYQFDLVTEKAVTVRVVQDGRVIYADSGILGSKASVNLQQGYTVAHSGGVLTVTLGKELLPGQTLTVSFTEKLRQRSTADGFHYVFTNYEAYLETEDGTRDPFPEPVVRYRGGKIPGELLNKDDHYSYIIGYPDGTVRPQGKLTRAEAVTIFFRMLTNEARDFYWSTSNPYTDVISRHWFNNAISTVTNLDIINGYPNGTFRPNSNITRAEFAKVAVGFFDHIANTYQGQFSDVRQDAWSAAYIQAAYELKLIEGYPDGTFRPNQPISRAEACTVINRVLDRVPHKDHLLSTQVMVTWPDSLPTAWYYAAMQEATNSHDYVWITHQQQTVEQWTEKLPQRDWAALEREWSTSNSAPFSGEVVH